MPTSDLHNITPILTAVTRLSPKSVLDIGCGFGKYGVLLREYLDIGRGRLERASWSTRIEAIEGFAGYRSPLWDYVYDQVHMGDAAGVLPGLDAFDVILIADVIEHFETADARALVTQCLAKCRTLVISTPKEFFSQTAEHGNPFEIHRCLWTAADFPPGVHVQTVPALSCNIYVASRTPLSASDIYPARTADILFLQSRFKLGRFGRMSWPISAALRALARVLT